MQCKLVPLICETFEGDENTHASPFWYLSWVRTCPFFLPFSYTNLIKMLGMARLQRSATFRRSSSCNLQYAYLQVK